jgi:patatin-like phospholipase/acyl hydrolase
MNQVNRGRENPLQPWQVFDMIGGTSTGGIIAVMLGRLRMTLDECHEAYIKLAKTIFKPKRCRFNIIGRGLDALSASERYDSQKFEEVVKAIIAKRKGSSRERLYSPEEGCKV